MRITPSSLLPVLAVALLAASASASTIDFSGISGANASKFSSNYSEDGFTVSPNLGTIRVSTTVGDMKPSLYGLAGSIAIELTAGGDFTFSGVDLGDSSKIIPEIYTITGYLNGSVVFIDPGLLPGENSLAFTEYGTSYSSDKIDELTIGFVGLGTSYIDNINVTPVAVSATPEPQSLVLLGSGLSGLGMLVRRRRRT